MNLHNLDDLPVNFEMYESLQGGNAHLWNVKDKVGATWKSRIRARGGFWTADCELNDTLDTQEKWFQEALMREIRLTVGGLTVWDGFIADMELRRHGEVCHRWWGDIRNRIKMLYTRIAPNLFTNGSAESGAWAAFGTPTTLEQSGVWRTHGLYSCHIITDADNEGAIIQTGIAIVAGVAYECKAAVKIVTGTWMLGIYRVDTGDNLGDNTLVGPAQGVMSVNIGEDNEYAGKVEIRIKTQDAAGEIYADEASFRQGSVSAETSYFEDLDSQVDYGIIEEALLEAGMSDDTANARVFSKLHQLAWPRVKPPETGSISGKDGLSIVLYGYVYTLRNKFSLATIMPDIATNIITSVLGESQYVSAGVIENNDMVYQPDDRGPVKGWVVARDVTLAGDANGNTWTCGVYAGRKFDYKMAENALVARWQDGKLWNLSGGEWEPWFALPGNVYMQDMPLGPADITGTVADNPRVMYLEELEFDAGAWLKDGQGLKFRKEGSSE